MHSTLTIMECVIHYGQCAAETLSQLNDDKISKILRCATLWSDMDKEPELSMAKNILSRATPITTEMSITVAAF
jgi:hypothetical protein